MIGDQDALAFLNEPEKYPRCFYGTVKRLGAARRLWAFFSARARTFSSAGVRAFQPFASRLLSAVSISA